MLETNKAQDEARVVRDRWEGGATKQERKALEEALAQREALYSGLAREAEAARVHADVANEQVSSMASAKREEKLEVEGLRVALRDLGSRSDDDTIIGKLTLELSQMKVSYQQFVRKFESSRANLRKAQLEVQKLEQQLDGKDASLQETRMKSRVRILAAEKALVQLKDDLHPTKSGASGSMLGQLETLNGKIRELTTRGEESTASLLDAEKGRIRLEGILQEKEEEYARTQEQLNDFKRFVQGQRRKGSSGGSGGRRPRNNRGVASDNMLDGGDGGDPFDDMDDDMDDDDMGGGGGIMSDGHSRDLARRLLSLSEELKAAKLRVLRQDRELKLLRDDKRNLQQQTKRDDETQRKLEEDLVGAQTALREKELQTLRETDPMGGTAGRRFRRDDGNDDIGDDDEFNGSTLGMSLMLETMPGQKTTRGHPLPAWAKEEDTHQHSDAQRRETEREVSDNAIKRMEGNNKTITGQMRRIAELEAETRSLHKAIDEQRSRADRRENESQMYSKQLREEGIPHLQTSVDKSHQNKNNSNGAFGRGGNINATPGRSSTDAPGTPGTEAARGQFYAGEANRLQQAARQTIAQLRSMLEKKSRLVEDYKRKLQEVRERSTAERQHDQEEIRRLTDRLYEENRVAIDKLRNAFDSIEKQGGASGGRSGGVNLTLMECMDQMTEAAAKKDRTLTEMRGELSAKSHQLMLAEQRAGAALTELDELRRRTAHLQRVVDSESTKKLIKQLKAQLANKEKKMSGLREAVVRLKEEFIKSEEEHEERMIETEEKAATSMGGGGSVSTMESASTVAERQRVVSGLRDKIQTLMSRMEVSRKELKATRDTSTKLTRGREAMERQIDVLKEQILRQSDTMGEQTSTIQEYQRREKDFRRRETELREKSSVLRRQENQQQTSRMSSDSQSFGNKVQEVDDSSSSSGEVVGRLKKRVRLLETQLAAYKSDAARTEQERNRLQDQLTLAQSTQRKQSRALDTGRGTAGAAGGQKDNNVSGSSHAEWAAQKRLRQRADTLAKRLRERTEELDVARKQVEHAKTQLERVSKEKSELASRISANRSGAVGASSKTSSGRGGGSHSRTELSAAVSSLQTGEEARKRMYELEQRCAGLTRVLEVEKEGELRTLRTERDALSDRFTGLEQKLEAARRRVKTLERDVESSASSLGSGGGSKSNEDGSSRGTVLYLRSSEDRFREQEELRGDLRQVTAERNSLEGRLLERDNLIMELRFDVEAATTTMPLLERRVRELETSNRALASQLVQMDRRGSGSGNSRHGSASPGRALSSSQSRKAGERFKRERDLEGVIESQNRVIMKMQAENERLTKRGVSASKIVEAQKELRTLRRRNKEFEAERQELLDRAAAASSAKLDVGKTKDLVRQLKRKLNTNEKKTNELRRNANDAVSVRRRVEEELAQANSQLSKAEKDVERLMTRGGATTSSSSSSSRGGRSEAELRRIAEENDALSSELNQVKSQLVSAERELRSASSGSRASSGASSGGGGRREKELEEENAKLRAELESFDLEFFEEVEDLKYKYSQAREENRRLKEQLK
jgi:chromosome segregation ATPase